jgi:transcriptional regulator with XRE-family HTH domain
MIPEFISKKYREVFVSAFVRQGIALQIQLLRKRETWSQKKLGEITGKKQNAITRLEDPSYGKFTITTLLELAKAFDVALSVKFVPFSELERQSKDLSTEALCVARYSDEMKADAAPEVPKNDRFKETASTVFRPSIQSVVNQSVSIRPGV